MRQNLSVYEKTKRTSKKGNQFWSVKTNKGTFSCFDLGIGDQIEINKINELETEIENNFPVIKEFYSVGAEVNEQRQNSGFKRADKFNQASERKTVSMYISYSKDLVIAEIQALTPYCKTKAEAEEVIKTARAKLFKDATAMCDLHDELLKDSK